MVQQRPVPLEGRAPRFEKHVTHSNSSLMEVRILGDVADADLWHRVKTRGHVSVRSCDCAGGGSDLKSRACPLSVDSLCPCGDVHLEPGALELKVTQNSLQPATLTLYASSSS